jgi:hypothetical protein
MHTPEWHEKQKIKKYLDARGCWHFSPFMKGYGKTGVPDIIGCLPISGRLFAIEVKRPGKQPTPLQYRRLQEISSKSGFAIWGDAVNVIDHLQKMR